MKNIVLCGFMGCGKSTVGAALARLLGRKFVDMDTEIERQAGMTVSEIFARFGEARFRKLEAEWARRLGSESGLVLSTGGGSVLAPANAEALKKNGVVVLIDVPPEVLRLRLSGDTARPLLKRGREDALFRLYAARMKTYRAVADIAVRNGDNRPAGQVAREIVSLLAHF